MLSRIFKETHFVSRIAQNGSQEITKWKNGDPSKITHVKHELGLFQIILFFKEQKEILLTGIYQLGWYAGYVNAT